MIINEPWVDKYLATMGLGWKTIQFANRYTTPQDAWDAWKDPRSLFWILFLSGADRKKLLTCLLEIVERVVPEYERRRPGDTRIREALGVVRRGIEQDSEENRSAVEAAVSDVDAITYDMDYWYQHTELSIASAVVHAFYAYLYPDVESAHDANDTKDHTRFRAAKSTSLSAEYAMYFAADASGDREEEFLQQCLCIKKYFPRSPFDPPGDAEENKPWVNKYLVPLGACVSAIRDANRFDSPQEAWEGWKSSTDLFWLLFKLGIPQRQILDCLADIVERVIPVFERKYPRDSRIRDAVTIVRECAENHSEENRELAELAAEDAYSAVGQAAFGRSRTAYWSAYAAYHAALCASLVVKDKLILCEEPENRLFCALSYASLAVDMEDSLFDQKFHSVDVIECSQQLDIQWQLKYIREHFSVDSLLQAWEKANEKK